MLNSFWAKRIRILRVDQFIQESVKGTGNFCPGKFRKGTIPVFKYLKGYVGEGRG